MHENDATLGPVTAPVTVVVFYDFECQYCQRSSEALKTIKGTSTATGSGSYLSSFLSSRIPRPGSLRLPLCALASRESTSTGPDWMFANQEKLTEKALVSEAAQSLGIGVENFSACVAQKSTAAHVDRDQKQGEDLEVDGTPTFFVNGRLLEGIQSAEGLGQVIDAEMALVPAQRAGTR